MRLKGKTALISGSGRNIGKAIALTFAREGADLILVSRTADEVKQVAKECEALGVRALPVAADVGKHEEVNRVVQQGLEKFGKVDVLVSTVGMRPHRPIHEVSYEEWHQVLSVNLHSIFYLCKALTPGMVERKSGSIIAFGGMASMTAVVPFTTAVVASKHGLYGFIKALAMELGPYGVRANLLAPGNIVTERRNPEWYHAGGDPNASKVELERTPLRRNGMPQEVANAALFLASDASSYITGDRMVCSGGRYM